jgi:hypothetical protein
MAGREDFENREAIGLIARRVFILEIVVRRTCQGLKFNRSNSQAQLDINKPPAPHRVQPRKEGATPGQFGRITCDPRNGEMIDRGASRRLPALDRERCSTKKSKFSISRATSISVLHDINRALLTVFTVRLKIF